MNFSKEERVRQFLLRLGAVDRVETAAAALLLIGRTLAAVEDDMTDIPNRPENWQTDGRMYPPQADHARDVEGRPELVRYARAATTRSFGTMARLKFRTCKGSCYLASRELTDEELTYECN